MTSDPTKIISAELDSSSLIARPAEPPPVDSLRSDWQTPPTEAEFALPVVQNFVSSAQACWGPTGVQNWIAPPTGLPSIIGALYRIDDAGQAHRVGPDDVGYQVAPSELLRRHETASSRLRLHPAAAAITEEITFHRPGRYAVLFGGLCRVWDFSAYWNLPPVDVPQLNVSVTEDRIVIADNKTFGRAVISATGGGHAVGYGRIEDFLQGRSTAGPGRFAAFVLDATAGQRWSWTGVQGSDHELRPSGDPDRMADEWEQLWQAAFTADNSYFSGHLPALDFGDPALNRLYYMGILSLLHGRRTPLPIGERSRFATGGQAIWSADHQPLPVAYTTGATEGAATTSFAWELHLTAPLLARLDPSVLRSQLEAFLVADTDRHWGIDILTGRGVGMWYGINDGALVTAAAAYLEATGDHDWLEHHVRGRSVREHLLHHVERHHELAGGGALADYGSADHVLECVSSYEHGIAAFNALAAWCYRFAAETLDPSRSEEFTGRATLITDAVIGLYAEGPFRCRTNDGDRIVRTCLDFIYVGRYLDDRLPPRIRDGMIDFFTRELETQDWMRALSASDPDSLTTALPSFQTFRADHQSTGAYDGWPGLAADVRLRFGDTDQTIDWLRRISSVTREGPFGQAHWVGMPGDQQPARKASFFNGNCSMLVSGCTLSETLLAHATVSNNRPIEDSPTRRP